MIAETSMAMADLKTSIKEKITLRFISIITLIWVADFFTKVWAVKELSSGQVINIVSDVFRFQLVYNTGGVFGIMQNNAMFFQFLTGFAILFLLFYYIKTEDGNTAFNFAISFILGGAVGNFTDRFFRHGVVDFIDMGIGNARWPTYNIADAFISTGAVLLAIAFFQIEKAARERDRAE
ncbi:MAG: signal peptidase II [Leptospiraceae bacterium]|nr:signal peptidase II [Leptospiraceae bacterium]